VPYLPKPPTPGAPPPQSVKFTNAELQKMAQGGGGYAAYARQVLGMQQQVNAATQQQVATVTRTAAVTGQITTRLGGAREAATQLGRALAGGTVSAESLLYAFGRTNIIIAAAVAAGSALAKIITVGAEAALEIAKNAEEEERAFAKVALKLVEMAKFARDVGDQIQLAEAINEQLDKADARLREFAAKQLTVWQKVKDAVSAATLFVPATW